jgi:hypothetical protein
MRVAALTVLVACLRCAAWLCGVRPVALIAVSDGVCVLGVCVAALFGE